MKVFISLEHTALLPRSPLEHPGSHLWLFSRWELRKRLLPTVGCIWPLQEESEAPPCLVCSLHEGLHNFLWEIFFIVCSRPKNQVQILEPKETLISQHIVLIIPPGFQGRSVGVSAPLHNSVDWGKIVFQTAISKVDM